MTFMERFNFMVGYFMINFIMFKRAVQVYKSSGSESVNCSLRPSIGIICVGCMRMTRLRDRTDLVSRAYTKLTYLWPLTVTIIGLEPLFTKDLLLYIFDTCSQLKHTMRRPRADTYFIHGAHIRVYVWQLVRPRPTPSTTEVGLR